MGFAATLAIIKGLKPYMARPLELIDDGVLLRRPHTPCCARALRAYLEKCGRGPVTFIFRDGDQDIRQCLYSSFRQRKYILTRGAKTPACNAKGWAALRRGVAQRHVTETSHRPCRGRSLLRARRVDLVAGRSFVGV